MSSYLSWELAIMDRLNQIHRASRVKLPKSVVVSGEANASEQKSRASNLVFSREVGIFYFLICGVIIIVAASALACRV